MKTFNVLETKTEKLKWEPEIVVISPFKSMPDDAWSACLDLIDDETLLSEIESIIETANDDSVLFSVLAYSEDQLVGFSLFNAWRGATESKGIMIAEVKDMPDFAIAAPFTQLIANLLAEKTMQETCDLKHHATIKDLKKVYVEKSKDWVARSLKKYKYVPVEVY